MGQGPPSQAIQDYAIGGNNGAFANAPLRHVSGVVAGPSPAGEKHRPYPLEVIVVIDAPIDLALRPIR